MNRIITAVLLSLVAFTASAGDTDDVIAHVEKLWEARNAMDYETQWDLVSKDGAFGANSNGTFFSYAEKGTVDDVKEGLAGVKVSSISVMYPKAAVIADGVVLARYYLEGQIEFADGVRESMYRTRVTQIWVKEDGEWKYRSWHFSPLHQGGVHRD